jgi:hypothetical protein
MDEKKIDSGPTDLGKPGWVGTLIMAYTSIGLKRVYKNKGINSVIDQCFLEKTS